MASTDPQEFTVALRLLESAKANGDGGTGLEAGNEAQLGMRQSGGLWGHSDVQLASYRKRVRAVEENTASQDLYRSCLGFMSLFCFCLFVCLHS